MRLAGVVVSRVGTAQPPWDNYAGGTPKPDALCPAASLWFNLSGCSPVKTDVAGTPTLPVTDMQPSPPQIDVTRLKGQRLRESQSAPPEEHQQRPVAPPSEAAPAGVEQPLHFLLGANLGRVTVPLPHTDFLAAEASAANEPGERERPKPLPIVIQT